MASLEIFNPQFSMKKIPNLDKLLSAKDINHSIIELDDFIGELCDDGDNFKKLTEPQKIFYLNQNLEREVNNGGFDQYFCNSAGENAHETVTSLKAIGANKTADILQRAINLVLQIIEQAKEVPEEIWDDFDREFYSYQDDLNALNIKYVEKHKDFF